MPGPRQRRMWVLPAPKGGLDKSDRYEIGIFYALGVSIIYEITKPIRALFTSRGSKPIVFKSKKIWNILISSRKQQKDY